MPLVRFPTPTGLVYTIDLTKIADRENPRTVEAPIAGNIQEPTVIDWGDGNSTTVNTTDSAWPEHTYAADGVYTVTLRSATGNLPQIRYIGYSNDATPTNLTLSTVSIDHYGGTSYETTNSTGTRTFKGCANLKYIDTRLVCQPSRLRFYETLSGCTELDMPTEAFCFDFNGNANGTTNGYQIFMNCRKLYGPAPNLDGMAQAISSLQSTFYQCLALTEPYVFWDENGDIDTEKFPILTAAGYCYTGCSDALRAQVPTAYGGTMTVS